MKKAITILLIFIFVFTTMPHNRVMAASTEQVDPSSIMSELESGEGVTLQNEKKSTGMTNSFFDIVGTILSFVFMIFPLVFQFLFSMIIHGETLANFDFFTIEDLLLGRYELFNVNFVNMASNVEAGYVRSSTNLLIKQNVSEWFYAMRNFAIVALLAVLIYIGILMAISTIASDKAKYKNMLIHWAASFAILMFLPYIITIAVNVSEVCVDIIRTAAENVVNVEVNNVDYPGLADTEGLNFEKTLLFGKIDETGTRKGMFDQLLSATGWGRFGLVCFYFILVYYQGKFLFMYLKRVFTVGFLIVISPLITITYSVDKAGDNQAQAYSTWMKEFLVNVFIQPLHALLFVIFMYSIYGILEKAPLLAVIFLASLSRGEKLVRTLFKVERTPTLGGLGKGK